MSFFYSKISSLGHLLVFSVILAAVILGFYFFPSRMQKIKKIIKNCITTVFLFWSRIKPAIAFLAICVGYWGIVLLVSISLSYLGVYYFGPYSPRVESVATAIIVWTGYVVVGYCFMSTYTFSEDVPAPRRDGSKYRMVKARRKTKR